MTSLWARVASCILPNDVAMKRLPEPSGSRPPTVVFHQGGPPCVGNPSLNQAEEGPQKPGNSNSSLAFAVPNLASRSADSLRACPE